VHDLAETDRPGDEAAFEAALAGDVASDARVDQYSRPMMRYDGTYYDYRLRFTSAGG